MVSTSRNIGFVVLVTALVLASCTEQTGPEPKPELRAATPTLASPLDISAPVTETTIVDGRLVDRSLDTLGAGLDLLMRKIPLDDECCSDIGQIHECWMEDAKDDGIKCPSEQTCLSSLGCDTDLELCRCTKNEDCFDGNTRFGVCVKGIGDTVGLCGPDWCNGYKVCSCWGGCVDAPIGIPEDVCAADSLKCCSGSYSRVPELQGDQVGTGFCTDNETCIRGCSTNAECDDENECTTDTCNLGTQECEYASRVGQACTNDGIFCNGAEFCVEDPATSELVCESTGTNPCPDDSLYCNGAESCDETNDIRIHSGDPCTSAAECEQCDEADDDCTTPVGNPCGSPDDTECDNPDTCDGNGNCLPNNAASGSICDDTLYCNGTDACDGNGSCSNHSGDPCLGGPQCDNICDESINKCWSPAGTGCDDANACTQTDTCDGIGNCTGSNKVSCPGTQCYSEVCNPGTGACVKDTDFPAGTFCLDGNVCTQNDACDGGGTCVGTPRNCNDGLECTIDSCTTCSGAGCNNTPEGGWKCKNDAAAAENNLCDADSDVCTVGDKCVGGFCAPGVDFDCTGRDDECVTGICFENAGTPDCTTQNRTNGTDCNADSNGCTIGDHCFGGICQQGTATPDCSGLDNADNCKAGVCSSTGAESYTCIQTSAGNGTPCNDHNGCTMPDLCSGGSCVGTTVVENQPDCTSSGCNDFFKCKSTADDSYECSFKSKGHDCCTVATPSCKHWCEGMDQECVVSECLNHGNGIGHCRCETASKLNQPCTNPDPLLYPANCFEFKCDGLGVCKGNELPTNVVNNKCEDLFSTGSLQTFGHINNDDNPTEPQIITVSGSNNCGDNNYRATGPDCVNEKNVNLGADGNDAVYAFTYDTTAENSFKMWIYQIKVWATFDGSIYVTDQIEKQSDCPTGSPANVRSDRCVKFNNDKDTVIEDFCEEPSYRDMGCYHDLLPGDDPNRKCGGNNCSGVWPGNPNGCWFYWVRRYWPSGCCKYNSGEDCESKCTGYWDYPDEPLDCNRANPAAGFSYQEVATHVIFPDGSVPPGTKKTVFIFVDGDRASDEGQFFISVERKVWKPVICERMKDDGAWFDLANVDGAGAKWRFRFHDAVNTMHSGSSPGRDCWYNCDFKTTWGGALSGSTKSPNDFWPPRIYMKLDRTGYKSGADYCMMADETDTPSANNMADATIQVWERAKGYEGLCKTGVYARAEARDNSGDNKQNAMLQYYFDTANPYIVSPTIFTYQDRPCSETTDQDCNIDIRMRRGKCGREFPEGYYTIASSSGAHTFSGSLVNADGYKDWNIGYDILDEQWELGNDTGAPRSVTIQMCATNFRGWVIVWNHNLSMVTYKWVSNNCQSLTTTIPYNTDADGQPTDNMIFVTAHKYDGAGTDYNINMTW